MLFEAQFGPSAQFTLVSVTTITYNYAITCACAVPQFMKHKNRFKHILYSYGPSAGAGMVLIFIPSLLLLLNKSQVYHTIARHMVFMCATAFTTSFFLFSALVNLLPSIKDDEKREPQKED